MGLALHACTWRCAARGPEVKAHGFAARMGLRPSGGLSTAPPSALSCRAALAQMPFLRSPSCLALLCQALLCQALLCQALLCLALSLPGPSWLAHCKWG